MLDDFGDAADACGDDGNFASHCLKSRKAEGFELRRKQKKIGGGELFVDGVLLAEKDVFFLGKQDAVYEKLAAADLFLLPSQLESFGLAALEAMACEVPVIGTNAGGMPEVVEHGVDGYLVEPGDVQAAARYAIQILSRPDRGREMGKAARVDAKKKFCANDVIPAYEAYYKRILSES